MKQILLNGAQHTTTAGSVAALIAELGFPKGTALVEHNGVALHPAEWERPLSTGDRIEILRIVAGG